MAPQSSIMVSQAIINKLDELRADGWGTVATIITVAVDRLYWQWKEGKIFLKPIGSPLPKRISPRLNPATMDQIQALINDDHGNQSFIILNAINRMYDQMVWDRKAAEDEDREPIAEGDYHYFNTPPAGEYPF